MLMRGCLAWALYALCAAPLSAEPTLQDDAQALVARLYAESAQVHSPVPQVESHALCDVDQDGDTDLLVGTLSKLVLFRRGAGGWPEQPHIWSLESVYARALHCGDVNGDGWNDLVVRSAVGQWRVFHNTGSGHLARVSQAFKGDPATAGAAPKVIPAGPPIIDRLPASPFAAEPQVVFRAANVLDAVAGDLDGDGDMDVLVAQAYGNRARVEVRGDDGSGGFVKRGAVALDGSLQALQLADMDGDGKLDLITVYRDALPRIHRGLGEGRFEEQYREVGLQIDDSLSLAVGDLDGDGRLDLVVGNATRAKRYLALGDARGWSGRTINRHARRVDSVLLADLDGDRALDILLCYRNYGPYLHRGQGRGAFLATEAPLYGGSGLDCSSMAAVDVNGDGHLDVLLSGSSVALLAGKGDGSFGDDWPLTLRGQVLAADIDGDGQIDLVSEQGVAFGDGSGGFQPAARMHLPERARLHLTDVNRDGALDLIAADRSHNGQVLLYLNTSAAKSAVQIQVHD
jgi:hypothetical protein